MKKIYFINFQKGVAIYLAIIITMILLSIGLGISRIVIEQFKVFREVGNSVSALSAADSGIEILLYLNKTCYQGYDPCPDYCTVPCGTLNTKDHIPYPTTRTGTVGVGNSSYYAEVTEPFLFVSTGTYGSVSRAIEVLTSVFNIVFVTKDIYTGDLGGIAGADQKCQDAAEAAGLSGKFFAWLSTYDGDDPESRFNKSLIPYRRTDGALVADTWWYLASGESPSGNPLRNPINIDQFGDPISGRAWTNTWGRFDMFGKKYYDFSDSCYDQPDCNCSDFTSADSDAYSIAGGTQQTEDGDWSDFAGLPCDNVAHLYCFEQ